MQKSFGPMGACVGVALALVNGISPSGAFEATGKSDRGQVGSDVRPGELRGQSAVGPYSAFEPDEHCTSDETVRLKFHDGERLRAGLLRGTIDANWNNRCVAPTSKD